MDTVIPIPLELCLDYNTPRVRWLYTDHLPTREVRFSDWARRSDSGRTVGALTTTLAEAEQTVMVEARHEPTGFIFHMSRCGSTLLANLLSTLPGVCVISEPQPLHVLLGAWTKTTDETTRERLLRILMAGFAPPRTWPPHRVIIKLVSTDVMALDVLKRCFPNVPWVFMCRDPLEVMVSALYSPPGWLREQMGCEQLRYLHTALEPAAAHRSAHILRRLLAAFVEHGVDGGVVVPYEELVEEGFLRVLKHFGVPTHDINMRAVSIEATYDAKDRIRVKQFVPDAQQKHAAASPLVRYLSDTLVRPIYTHVLSLSQRPATVHTATRTDLA